MRDFPFVLLVVLGLSIAGLGIYTTVQAVQSCGWSALIYKNPGLAWLLGYC